MEPVGLKCPNCGAPISSSVERCGNCGTYFLFQDNVPTPRSSYECPECKVSIGAGSYVCCNCGKVLTTDPKELGILRGEQKRIRFFHNERLNSAPIEIRQKLQPDEYVYCVVEAKEGVGVKYTASKQHFVVTDKRILVHKGAGLFSKPMAREISYDSIAGLAYEDFVDLGFTLAGVRTFKENENLTITFPLFSPEAENFRTCFETAFEDHRLQRKDIMALLCFASV